MYLTNSSFSKPFDIWKRDFSRLQHQKVMVSGASLRGLVGKLIKRIHGNPLEEWWPGRSFSVSASVSFPVLVQSGKCIPGGSLGGRSRCTEHISLMSGFSHKRKRRRERVEKEGGEGEIQRFQLARRGRMDAHCCPREGTLLWW